jgi:hypothetical protein
MAVTEDNSTLIIATSFASKLLALKITDGGDLVERRTFAEVAGTMDFGAAISPAGVVRTAHIQLGRFPRESLMASTVGISAR